MCLYLETLQKSITCGQAEDTTLLPRGQSWMVRPDPADLYPAWFPLRGGQFVQSQMRANALLKIDFSSMQHLAAVTFLCMLISVNLSELFANSPC